MIKGRRAIIILHSNMIHPVIYLRFHRRPVSVAGVWSSATKMEGSVISIHAEKQAGGIKKEQARHGQYTCQTADTDQYLTNLHRTRRGLRRCIWLALRNLLKSSVSSTQDCDRHATLQLKPAVTTQEYRLGPKTAASYHRCTTLNINTLAHKKA